MALREGRFSGQAYDKLAADIVQSSTKDKEGELGRLLSCQYRAFKHDDPPPVQQKALPACVFRELAKMVMTECQKATSQLVTGNFSLLVDPVNI